MPFKLNQDRRQYASPEVAHVVNVLSAPLGWSAGKWYSDVLDPRAQNRLTTDVAKPY